MDIYLTYIIIVGSFVSMAGTMFGASLGVLVKNPSNRMLAVITGFAGGIMLSVVVFDLLPEAINNWNLSKALFFSIVGMVIVMAFDSAVGSKKSPYVKAATITSLGLMMHNFPEGIIMGCGFASGTTLGIKMALIIGIHDIPEGMAVAAPLMASKAGKLKIMIYAIFTAIPTLVGALAGGLISNISGNILGCCLSLASGIMLYVVCGEMLPQSSRLWNGRTRTIGVLLGILCGFVITNVL